jgi:hypothetical protein
MQWYRRPDGSFGDSLTDVGALSLIGGYDCAAHVRACQRADGSFFRHPDYPDSGMSRDHLISICHYTAFSGDREPLKKFLSYSLRNWGKVAEGSLTHGYLTPVVLAAILAVLGHKKLSALLDLINWPVMLLSALILKPSYMLILLCEHSLLRILSGRARWPWMLLARLVLRKEPTNLYYRIVCGEAGEFDALAYMSGFPRARLGGVWHWNNPSDPQRQATGVDLEYVIHLARRLA